MSTPPDDPLLNLPPLQRMPDEKESDSLRYAIVHWALELDEATGKQDLAAARDAKGGLKEAVAAFRAWQKTWHSVACCCWSCRPFPLPSSNESEPKR